MSVNVNFNTLALTDDGIVLGLKNNQKKEISFLELDKIYMKTYRLKPVYELGFILFPFLLILLAVQFMMLEKVMFMALFAVVPVYVKAFRYKRYGLTMCLNDGTVFTKKVPLKLKAENITVINTVKKARMEYGVAKRQLNALKVQDFCLLKAV